MNIRTLGLTAAAVVSTLAIGLMQTGSAYAVTIAYSGYPPSQSAFWGSVSEAAKAEAAKEGITLLDITTPEADAAAQKDAIDTAINQKVDGIIIGAIDNRAFDDTLAKAKAAGIPVVAIDTGIDNPWVKSLIQTDNLAAAKVAGQYIVDHATKGTVLIVGGSEGHQTGNARRDGVIAAVTPAGFKVIFQICDWKADCAYDQTLTQTKSNPDITAVFAAWDGGALAAENAVKENGKVANIVVVGFDGSPANFDSIKAGEQAATMKQDSAQMGTAGVQNVVALINGKAPPALIPIPGILIDKSNVDSYIGK